MDKNERKPMWTRNVAKRLAELGKISNEVINLLAKQKVGGETINTADTYFILGKTIQKVSLDAIIQVESFKQKKRNRHKMVV